ncbi:MAG TPA: hypothetical protein ENK96_03745 [Desulfobulbaceae bacterium]|nr:hypothetical protein [Desulfobulbaceae bacterium]
MPGSAVPAPTKITRPLCNDIFPRTRLYTRLDQLLDKPALWISGPPGSGKTALVSSYIEQKRLTCIWYQIDGEDSDPSTFFYYLAKGAELAAGKRISVPPFTAEYYENPLSFTRWYFEQLCTQFIAPFMLVFDNYQELPEDSVIHTILGTIIGDLPPGMQLVFISRNRLPGAFIRLQLNRKIGTITWNDLQLTLTESEGILTMLGLVPGNRIPLLHDKAAGWVAGLLLLEAGMDTGKPADINLSDVPQEEIFQYFASEIFNRQDNKTRIFLLRTSFLPHMTISMAKELSGEQKTAEILLTLNRRNYFVSRRPGRKSTYQYHPLFKEFLQNRAERDIGENERIQLFEKAGNLLLESGEIEEAASLFITAKSWSRLVGLILENASVLFTEGRIRPLMEWIEKIPAEIMNDSPWLLYWLGTCRIFLDPVNSTPLLEEAYQEFAGQQNTTGMLLAWAAIVNSILLKSGSFAPFQKWIKEFSHLEHLLDRQPLQVQAPVIVSMLYALGLASTDSNKFDRWMERGHQLIQEDIDVVNKAHTFNLLIVKTQFRGDLAAAEYYLTLFRSFAASQQLPPFSLIQLQNCAASCAWLSGRFEECKKEGHAGLKIAETSGVHLYNHYLWGQLAAGALSTGRLSEAEHYQHEMAGCMDRMRPWEQSFFHVLSTWAALLEGNTSQAVLQAEKGVQLIKTMGTKVNTSLIYLGMALALDRADRMADSMEYLNRSMETAQQAGDQQTTFINCFVGAMMFLHSGDKVKADSFLRQGFALGKAKGYVNCYFWDSKMMEQLCYRALEREIEEEYVQNLIRRRQLVPSSPPLELENWPWKIKIFTLGRFSLLIDNKPVTFYRKGQMRPLELLYALIALGGRSVSKEKIEEYLWPDALGDAAGSAFSTTLYRLRKLLTVPEAVIVQNETITLNPQFCWVDTWAFERFIAQADSVSSQHIENKFAFLQKAIALYHGIFLQEQGNIYWFEAIRERLRKKYSRITLQLADRLIQTQDVQSVTDFLEKVITVDPANENLYQRFMKYYRETGLKKKSSQPVEKNTMTSKRELN